MEAFEASTYHPLGFWAGWCRGERMNCKPQRGNPKQIAPAPLGMVEFMRWRTRLQYGAVAVNYKSKAGVL